MPVNIQAYNKNPHFGDFQEMLKASIPLVVRQKQLQQEHQQHESYMNQRKAELAEEANKSKMKLAAETAQNQLDNMFGMLQTAHETNNQQAVDYLSPLVERLSNTVGGGVVLPRGEDGNYLVMSPPDDDSVDQLTAHYLKTNNIEGLKRIADLKKAGSTQVTQNVNEAKDSLNDLALKKAYEARGKESVEAEKTYRENVKVANRTVSVLSSLKESLRGIDTGAITPAMMQVARWGRAFGYDLDPKLDQKQQAEAFFNQIALDFRNPAGGAGMPGHLSDKDLAFLIKVAGNLSMEKGALLQLIEIRKKLAQRQIAEGKFASNYVKKHKYLDENYDSTLADWAEKNVLFDDRDYTPGKKSSEKPPVEGAKKAPDGFWYVEKEGKYFKWED